MSKMATVESSCVSVTADENTTTLQLDDDELTKCSNGSGPTKSPKGQSCSRSPTSTTSQLGDPGVEKRRIQQNTPQPSDKLNNETAQSCISDSSISNTPKSLELLSKLVAKSESEFPQSDSQTILSYSTVETMELLNIKPSRRRQNRSKVLNTSEENFTQSNQESFLEEKNDMPKGSTGSSGPKKKKGLEVRKVPAARRKYDDDTTISHSTKESSDRVSNLLPEFSPTGNERESRSKSLGEASNDEFLSKPALRVCRSDDLSPFADGSPKRRGVRRSTRRNSLAALVQHVENPDLDLSNENTANPMNNIKADLGNPGKQKGLILPQKTNVWSLDAKLMGDSRIVPRRHSFVSVDSHSISDDTFGTTSGAKLKIQPIDPPKKKSSRRDSAGHSSASPIDQCATGSSRKGSNRKLGQTSDKLSRSKLSDHYPASPFSIHDDKKKGKSPLTSKSEQPSLRKSSRRHSVDTGSRTSSRTETIEMKLSAPPFSNDEEKLQLSSKSEQPSIRKRTGRRNSLDTGSGHMAKGEASEVKIEYKSPKQRSSRRHSALGSSPVTGSFKSLEKDAADVISPDTISKSEKSAALQTSLRQQRSRRHSALSTTSSAFDSASIDPMGLSNRSRILNPTTPESRRSTYSGLTKTMKQMNIPSVDITQDNDSPPLSTRSRYKPNVNIPRNSTRTDEDNDMEAHRDLLGSTTKSAVDSIPRSPIRSGTRNKIQMLPNPKSPEFLRMIAKSPIATKSGIESEEEIHWKRTDISPVAQNGKRINRRSSCPAGGSIAELQDDDSAETGSNWDAGVTSSFGNLKNIESVLKKHESSSTFDPKLPTQFDDDMFEDFSTSTNSMKGNMVSLSERHSSTRKKSDSRFNEDFSKSLRSFGDFSKTPQSKTLDLSKSLSRLNTSNVPRKKNTLNKYLPDERRRGMDSLPLPKLKNGSQIVCRNDFDGSISSMSDCMSNASSLQS